MANRLVEYFLRLLYPPKCIFCRRVLRDAETDICHRCRAEIPAFDAPDRMGEFFSCCISAYFYQDAVRESLLRYKFSGMAQYADGYGRALAMTLSRKGQAAPQLVTWVPVSKQRKRARGYDQAQLLAQAVARELGCPVAETLRKTMDNPPQSSLKDAAHRRGNVIGVYECVDAAAVADKQILLIDDIITTGATLSECSRVLKSAGARGIVCATMAATPTNEKSR